MSFTRAISEEFFDSPHPKLVVKAKPKLSAEAGRFFLLNGATVFLNAFGLGGPVKEL